MKIINVTEVTALNTRVYRIETDDGRIWTAPLDVDGEVRRAMDRYFRGEGDEPSSPPSNAPAPLTL